MGRNLRSRPPSHTDRLSIRAALRALSAALITIAIAALRRILTGAWGLVTIAAALRGIARLVLIPVLALLALLLAAADLVVTIAVGIVHSNLQRRSFANAAPKDIRLSCFRYSERIRMMCSPSRSARNCRRSI